MIFSLRQQAVAEADRIPDLILQAEHIAAGVLSGEHNRHRAGNGEKFWQYREYDPSDRPQDIDWRQSAKGDRIFIRQKEWQTTQTALFWCQNDASMDYGSGLDFRNKHETAMIIALALAMLATNAGEQVAALNSADLPGRQDNAIEKMARHMIQDETADLPDSAAMQTKRHSTIFLIGDFLAPVDNIKERLRRLTERSNNIVLIQVLDDSELTLPFNGRVIFRTPEIGSAHTEEHLVENIETIRSEYQLRMANHIALLSDLCRKQGWHFISHNIANTPSDSLLALWHMMRAASGSYISRSNTYTPEKLS